MQLSLSVSLTAINRFMSSTAAVVPPAPALDRVVNFVATGSDAMYQDSAIFNSAGAFPATGGWMMAFMYYDGTNWTGNLMGLADTASASRYMDLNGNQFIVRDNLSMTTLAAATPAVGWHLVTGRFTRHASTGTTILANYFRRDGDAEVAQTAAILTGVNPALFARLGLGYRPRSTPDTYATFKASGFAVGTGDPASLHAWVYNGGAFGRKITDYPGDAGVAITHYWPGARVGDATLSGSEAALQDTVGSLDAWTLIGAPVWATPAPPFEAGIVTATATAAAVPSGATNTMVITATIPTGRVWGGTPTVDLSKVDLWTTLGFGPITATAAAVSLDGTTATVTLTLDRAIYASEPLQCALAPDWLKLTGAVQSDAYVAAPTNSSPTADPANWPGVSMGRVAWRFQTPISAGYHADGIPWVAAGAVITDEYPLRAGGKNGAIKNPLRVSRDQSFDSTLAYYFAPPALPWTLAAGDTVLKARSNPNPLTEGGGTVQPGNVNPHPVYFSSYGGLVCRASAPAANEYAPPIVYDTPASRPAGPIIDVTSLTFPTYATTGHDRPTAAMVQARLDVFNPAVPLWYAVEERRQRTPSGVTMNDGYGLKVAGVIQAAGLVLIGDDTTAAKRAMAKRLIMHGVQWYHGIAVSAQTDLPGDGGQNEGLLLPMACYLAWTGQTAALAAFEADVGTNELRQSATVDSTLLAAMTAEDATTPTYHSVGVHEWIIKGPTNLTGYYQAGPDAAYRNLNSWSGALLTLRALGFVHSTWADFQGVVVRANTGDYPAGTGWPTHHGAYSDAGNPGGYQWDAGFWASHWAAISAVSQTVG